MHLREELLAVLPRRACGEGDGGFVHTQSTGAGGESGNAICISLLDSVCGNANETNVFLSLGVASTKFTTVVC